MNTDAAIAERETADVVTSSDDYASRFAGAVGTWMLKVQEKIVLDFLRPAQPRTVLDVGGGHGQLAGPLARAGYAVTVAGSAPACARRIRDEIEAGCVKFLTADVLHLPYPDRAFDAVVSVRLLPHCQRWPEFIGELCRVAGRVVVVDYPTVTGLNKLAPALFEAKKKLEGNTRVWRNFSHAEVEDAFSRHGFRLRRRGGQFFLPMVLHRSLHCRPLSAGLEGICRGLGLTSHWGSPVLALFERRS